MRLESSFTVYFYAFFINVRNIIENIYFSSINTIPSNWIFVLNTCWIGIELVLNWCWIYIGMLFDKRWDKVQLVLNRLLKWCWNQGNIMFYILNLGWNDVELVLNWCLFIISYLTIQWNKTFICVTSSIWKSQLVAECKQLNSYLWHHSRKANHLLGCCANMYFYLLF